VLIPLSANAEPYFEGLREYALGYLDISEEGDSILNAVREEDTDILEAEGFNDQEFERLTAEIRLLVEVSLPQINSFSKSLRAKGNFLESEEFEVKIEDYKEYLEWLVEIASAIKADRSSFLPQYDVLKHIGHLHSWARWQQSMRNIHRERIKESQHKFEMRYGERSDKLNGVEYLIVNYIPWFKGSEKSGPSPREPILRFTPAYYNFTEGTLIKAFSVGVNYYFFDDSSSILRFLQNHVHHFGVALVLAEFDNKEFHKWNKLAYGAEIHVSRCQIGVIKDPEDDDWEIISTVNFQVIPRIF